MNSRALSCIAVLLLGAPAVEASAAEPAYLVLFANGVAVKGESSKESLGRKDAIECVFYEQRVITAREAGTGMATGRRQYEPLVCRKRIDKASPLLLKALSDSAKVEGYFRFFRPGPLGDGNEEQFQVVQFWNGRIASVRHVVPSVVEILTSVQPALEEITIVFGSIRWTNWLTGASASDSWSTN